VFSTRYTRENFSVFFQNPEGVILIIRIRRHKEDRVRGIVILVGVIFSNLVSDSLIKSPIYIVRVL
jgi:hypothetical protein